ncbi:MAG: hlyD [Caulobacteraceae bacterium]|nr:hlyD [Caulobacteraceae bacterium]
MTEPLFRPEVAEQARRRLDGTLLLATPLSMKFLSALFVAVVLIAVLFLCLGVYARKETAAGWITPQGGIIRIVAPQGGVVESLPFSEGDMAPLGAQVATLRLTSSVDGANVGEAVNRGIDSENQANQDQLAAGEKKIGDLVASLRFQRAGLVQDLQEGGDRVTLLQQKQDLARTTLSRYQQLFQQGDVSAAAVDSVNQSYLSAVQATSQARSSNLATQREIDDVDRQLAQAPNDSAALQAQAAQLRASLSQKSIGVSAQSSYVAQAPINGRLMAIPVELGQAVPPGATIAVMTGAASTLGADLYVPSRAAGFIRPGQTVNLMYQAFPYQKFGVGHGHIQSVSRTVLGPGETAIPGLDMKEPVFRVRVALDKASVSAYGQDIPLQPGMLLSADIVIDRRSLIEWLLDPIYAVRDRAS